MRIKRNLISIWKIYKRETTMFLTFIILSKFCMSYTLLSISAFVLGLLTLLLIVVCKKKYIDKYHCYFYTNPLLSNRSVLFQSIKKHRHDCQDIMEVLFSKKKAKEIISQLPSGNYKSITHNSVINVIKTFDSDIHISKVIYKDKLSSIRKRLLGKKCPCSDDVECKYRKYISFTQQQNGTTDFHYIKFTIK